jgi:plasmid stabilization system protein ParE
VSRGYRLAPEAQIQLGDIIAFIAEDNANAANRLLDAFELAFHQLADMPEIGHERDDLTKRPVKFWTVFSYLIVYDPASTPLAVVAVLHGARDVRRLLKAG